MSVSNRLPAADDCGREYHGLNVPIPVAARLCAHPACLAAALPGCTRALPYGAALQRPGRPHQTGVASGGQWRAQIEQVFYSSVNISKLQKI